MVCGAMRTRSKVNLQPIQTATLMCSIEETNHGLNASSVTVGREVYCLFVYFRLSPTEQVSTNR